MIVKLQLVGKILMIFAIVLSVSIFVNVKPRISSFSNVAGEDRNFLNGINIPNDR
jgi:hypothetical protein